MTGFNFDDTGSDITTDDTIENQNLADDEVFVDVNNSNSSKATLASDHSNLSD